MMACGARRQYPSILLSSKEKYARLWRSRPRKISRIVRTRYSDNIMINMDGNIPGSKRWIIPTSSTFTCVVEFCGRSMPLSPAVSSHTASAFSFHFIIHKHDVVSVYFHQHPSTDDTNSKYKYPSILEILVRIYGLFVHQCRDKPKYMIYRNSESRRTYK